MNDEELQKLNEKIDQVLRNADLSLRVERLEAVLETLLRHDVIQTLYDVDTVMSSAKKLFDGTRSTEKLRILKAAAVEAGTDFIMDGTTLVKVEDE